MVPRISQSRLPVSRTYVRTTTFFFVVSLPLTWLCFVIICTWRSDSGETKNIIYMANGCFRHNIHPWRTGVSPLRSGEAHAQRQVDQHYRGVSWRRRWRRQPSRRPALPGVWHRLEVWAPRGWGGASLVVGRVPSAPIAGERAASPRSVRDAGCSGSIVQVIWGYSHYERC